jgi:ABC-type microcin C transport system permease subunit YejB
MIRFLAARLLGFALTLAAVVVVSFVLMHAVRGGPFDATAGSIRRSSATCARATTSTGRSRASSSSTSAR